YVGDRYNNTDNFVVLNGYTVFDAYMFIDVPKSAFMAADNARITFRVKNLTDKLYAAWGDPGYPDQIILGAPRSYEVAASFKWWRLFLRRDVRGRDHVLPFGDVGLDPLGHNFRRAGYRIDA